MNSLFLSQRSASLNITRTSLLIGIVLLSLIDTGAQSLTPSQFGNKLDEVVPGLLAKHKEPGLAVALIDDCQVSWTKTYGKADIQQDRSVNKDTIFQMGSISKTLTAWGIMRLVEKGLIDLDEPAEKYLKRWKLPKSEFNKMEVTVRRLLDHTAGISLSSISGVDLGAKVPSFLEELNGIGPSGEVVRIINNPGEKHEYSGGGYTILQLLIEDVTGKSFDEYMRTEVLKPLRMNDTHFGWNKHVKKAVATPYKAGGVDPHPHRLFSSLSAAGLYSSAEDMAKFVIAQCRQNNKTQKAISTATYLQMIKSSKNSPRYGLGYEIFAPFQEVDIVGHGGSNLGWKTNFVVVPDKGLGIVILSNVDEGKTRMDVLNAFRKYLGEKLKP